MEFEYIIPLTDGTTKRFAFKPGTSAVFVGANGSGKSRLGAHLEIRSTYKAITHRVGAQRALRLPNAVPFKDRDKAQTFLLYGSDRHMANKELHRWHSEPTTYLLDDFQHLLTALFSEEFERAMEHKQDRRANPSAPWPSTKLGVIKAIWEDIIATRTLSIRGASIYLTDPETETEYEATQMSDGERVLLYLVGQCMMAKENGIIIIDEPELHVHKAILTKLWDMIESERPDCLFIYLTHDLEFAKSRTSGQKFAVRKFNGEAWDIVEIPDDEELLEEITTRILGSRKPVLFVEGEGQSKDANIYGKVYQDFTIVPVGSCGHVIHLTRSYNARKELHYLACYGLIDKDGRDDTEVRMLRHRDIHTIEFSEIENVLLMEEVLREASRLLGFDVKEAENQVEEVKRRAFELAATDVERTCVRFAKRRIGAAMEAIGFQSKTMEELSKEFRDGMQSLSPEAIYTEREKILREVVQHRNYRKLLEIYDNKGLVKQIGGIFGLKANEYTEFVVRQMGGGTGTKLLDTVRSALPDLQGVAGERTTGGSHAEWPDMGDQGRERPHP